MLIVNRFADVHEEIASWRRDFHRHPELLYDVHRTAGRVAELLRSFGVDEVVTGIGRTGVVGVIRGKSKGGVIGLRADMDALPITEATGLPHASKHPGLMHACGHDGHSAMLLGAARNLTQTRNFAGTAVVIFQPAEEGGAGGKAMVEDGMMERFGIEEVYGMHNMPGVPVGRFATRPGPIMASTAEFQVLIRGTGGHAARPHETVDPIPAAAAMIQALQSIVSRNVDPLESAVVSVTTLDAGTATNIIPDTVELGGTIRSLRPSVADLVEDRFRAVVSNIAVAFGATAEIRIKRNYPVTVNHATETARSVAVAESIVGSEHVDPQTPPIMGAEDFSFMLEARPGSFIFIGNGDTAGLHSASYDFNDEVIPIGCSYWVRLVEERFAA
jgi:amidohydrolase